MRKTEERHPLPVRSALTRSQRPRQGNAVTPSHLTVVRGSV